MDIDFAHPKWIVVGLAMVFAGIVMVRWASRNNMAKAISSATTEATVNKLRRAGGTAPRENPETKKKLQRYGVRNALSQLVGSLGFIAVIAGLIAAVLGIFYSPGSETLLP